MLNIGCRPTFNGQKSTIEVHVFNFNKDIYGEFIKIAFFKRIRDEKKFDSEEGLKNQLVIDKNKVLKIFS